MFHNKNVRLYIICLVFPLSIEEIFKRQILARMKPVFQLIKVQNKIIFKFKKILSNKGIKLMIK